MFNKKDNTNKNIVIDLNDTDGDSDLEEQDENEYEDDGFIVFETQVDQCQPPLFIEPNKAEQHKLDARSDRLWYNMLDKQFTRWTNQGKKKNELKELVFKLGQFRTQNGIKMANDLQKKYNIII